MEEYTLIRKVGVWAGVSTGLTLILFGLTYEFIFRNLFGFQPAAFSMWSNTRSFAVENKTLIIFLGVIIAPICEEVFFRGGIFKNFSQNGYILYGIFFSSLFFASAHFDLLSFPVYFVFGILLALTYSKTNSIVPSMIAHAVNNAFAFYLLYA